MTEPITHQQLVNASLDAKTLEQVINGDDNTDVTSRLGATYPTLDKALRLIVEHGLLGATPFATYQAMAASGLANNSYAVVTTDAPDKNGIYQNIDGSWVYSPFNDTIKNTKYIDALVLKQVIDSNIFESAHMTKDGKKVLFALADKDNNVGVTVDELANINAGNLRSDIDGVYAFAVTDDAGRIALGIDKSGNVSVGGMSFASVNNQLYAFAITDDSNRVAFAVDKNGNLHSATTDKLRREVDVLLADKAQASDVDALKQLSNVKTDYMHIVSYGQSLSRGATSRPPVSKTQPYHNVTFVSGVLPRHNETHDYNSFKPLTEQEFGSEGETPTSAMLNNLVRYRVEAGESADDWVFIGTAPGQGGQPIRNLHKGTLRWTGMLEQFESAYNIAQSQGKSYSVWAIAWTQGENDYGSNTTHDDYYRLLLQMHRDFVTDVVTITKQTFRPPLVMYQVAAHRRYQRNTQQIALAQLKASQDVADIIMACPIYHLPHNTDNLHLTADSSYQLGLYYAKALHQTLYGDKWQPLQPASIIAQGKVIDITFNKSGLVFDTELVAQTHNMGFDVFDTDGNLLDIIVSVSIIESNRIKIILSDMVANAVLCYGRGRQDDPMTAGPATGARGNLRDSAGDSDYYTDTKGVVRYMHNWCVMFNQLINKESV